MQADKIIIIDFGSQYTKLIARKVRECHVYSEVISPSADITSYKSDGTLKGIILSGGPASVFSKNAPSISRKILDLNVPILGICYGLQLISYHFKGGVKKGIVREYGKTRIHITGSSRLLEGINNELTVWMSHSDYINELPPEFYFTSRSENELISSFENTNNKIYGVQFHPEVHHTEYGIEILNNFLHKICGIVNKWKMGSFIDEKIGEIRERIGRVKALCALSGGVDSTVAAFLVNKAIGKNLICVHIDNGLMRKNESKDIIKYFKNQLNPRFINGSDTFLKRLKGVVNPEKKRRIIGKHS